MNLNDAESLHIAALATQARVRGLMAQHQLERFAADLPLLETRSATPKEVTPMSPTPEDLRDEWLRLLIASEDANAAQGDAYAVMASAYRRKHIEDVLASGELLTPRSLERIEVPNLTDPETIARYNELRGYTTEPEPTPTPEPEPEPEPEEAPEAPAEPEAPATKPEAVEE